MSFSCSSRGTRPAKAGSPPHQTGAIGALRFARVDRRFLLAWSCWLTARASALASTRVCLLDKLLMSFLLELTRADPAWRVLGFQRYCPLPPRPSVCNTRAINRLNERHTLHPPAIGEPDRAACITGPQISPPGNLRLIFTSPSSEAPDCPLTFVNR